MQLTVYGKCVNLINFVNNYLGYKNQNITSKIVLGQFTDWPGGTVPSFDVAGPASDTLYASEKGVTVTVKKIAVVRNIQSGDTSDVTYNGTNYHVLKEFTSSVPSPLSIVDGSTTKLLYVELKLSSAADTVTFRQIGFTNLTAQGEGTKKNITSIYQNVPPLSIVPINDADSGIVVKVMFAF